MKVTSKILTHKLLIVVIFWSIGLSAASWSSPKAQPQDTFSQNPSGDKADYPKNDSLAALLCDKYPPYFTNLDPDSGQVGVDLKSAIKFRVNDDYLPKKNEWDHFGVDTNKIFISIKTRFWEIDSVRPHKITLVDSIFRIDCEYYPDKPFDWSDTIIVTLSATDTSWLKNHADTTYSFYTVRDTIAPVLTPIYPERNAIGVPIDSGLIIQGTEIGKGVVFDDIELWIKGIPVTPDSIVGDPWSFKIYATPDSIWDYGETVPVTCTARDLDGNVGRLDYSFTIESGIPLPPQLVSPANGTDSLDTTVPLVWREAARATSYGLQVSLDLEFSNLVFDNSVLPDTNHTAQGLQLDMTYYWRANASNDYGTSGWSEVWHFSTRDSVGPGNAPLPPQLVSPANGTDSLDITVPLVWRESAGATSYGLQVSLDSLFNSFVINNSEILNTTFNVDGLRWDTTYYWRANASNQWGSSGWSVIWQFSTRDSSGNSGNPPLPPQLVSPANGTDNLDTTVPLVWREAARATSYGLQVSLDSLFNSFVINNSEILNTTFNVDGLWWDTTYYWRANASNQWGSSGWSEVWHFSTRDSVGPGNPPLPPQLVSPANGTDSLDTIVPLVWRESARATSYGLQVSLDLEFSNLVFDNSVLPDTNHTAQGLQLDMTYYWRANASNDYGTSGWSEVWHFSTRDSVGPGNAPLPPQLVSPENGTDSLDTSIPLVWRESVGATSYGLQVSLDSLFNSQVVNNTGLVNTTRNVDRLEWEMTYYWRANASNEYGASDWSEVWHFSTRDSVGPGNAPLPPQLVSPENGTDSLDTSIPLVWRESVGATSYGLQVSSDSRFSNLVLDNSGLVATTHTVDGLGWKMTYYWRANASNDYGTSGWSEVWHFSTSTQGGQSAPDLIVTDFINLTNGSIKVQKTDVKLCATIKAINTDCPGIFSVNFYLDTYDKLIQSVPINGINKDDSIPVETSFKMEIEGSHNVIVYVDAEPFPNGQVFEENEKNNEDTLAIKVVGAQLIVRSNPFTPNDDDINDEAEFNFEQFEVKEPNLKIFDMHGKKVKEFDIPINKRFIWKGMDSSERPLLPGIYLYIFSDRNEPIARGCVVIAR